MVCFTQRIAEDEYEDFDQKLGGELGNWYMRVLKVGDGTKTLFGHRLAMGIRQTIALFWAAWFRGSAHGPSNGIQKHKSWETYA